MSMTLQNSDTSLPAQLPKGEEVLWQGRPSWQALAVRAFHVRKIGIYFALILVAQAALRVHSNYTVPQILTDSIPVTIIGMIAIGFALILAFIYARTTTYTITNRRIFMRIGAALPMMINIPFKIVGAASAKVNADGTADIPVQLLGNGRVAYLHLWPHARPWHLSNPQPMLRGLPEGARVAALLASALSDMPPPASESAVRTMTDTISAETPESVFAPAAA